MKKNLYLLFIITLVSLGCKKEKIDDSNRSSETLLFELENNLNSCQSFRGFPEIPGWTFTIQEIGVGEGTNGSPYFYFFDEQMGFVTDGIDENLFQTQNGGLTWNERLSSSEKMFFEIIDFIDIDLGFLSGLHRPPLSQIDTLCSKLFKTNDGGESWSEIHFTPKGDLHSLNMLDEKNGFAIISQHIIGDTSSGPIYSFLHKTKDGGETWEKVLETRILWRNHESIQIMPSGFGYFPVSLGGFITTEDFGETWEVHESNFTHMFELQFFNKNVGLAFIQDEFQYKLIKTTDGGATWNDLIFTSGPPVFMRFLSEDEGFISIKTAYDQSGTGSQCYKIYYTADGGETWLESESSRDFFIKDLHFFNENEAICAFRPKTYPFVLGEMGNSLVKLKRE